MGPSPRSLPTLCSAGVMWPSTTRRRTAGCRCGARFTTLRVSAPPDTTDSESPRSAIAIILILVFALLVTAWMENHPGGKEILLLAAGRDITYAFDSYHPFTEKPEQGEYPCHYMTH